MILRKATPVDLCRLMKIFEFRLPNWSLLLKLMNNPVIIDGRNIYDAEELQHLGFDYYCIGR